MIDHLVQFSGGVGSWATARRVRDSIMREGDTLTLLFADTKMEDEDLYRYLEEAAADVGGELVKIADGRDVWEVFTDKRYLGNSRVDPCSRILKRDLLRAWMDEHRDPETTLLYLGIDWSEIHRFERAEPRFLPFRAFAPLCSAPFLDKADHLRELERRGIAPPRLYELGFPHNNCGGFCVKAGISQFALLYRTMPERYLYHERKEQELRELLDKDVAILTDRRGGEKHPMTLRALRERIDAGEQVSRDSWGGCGCAIDDSLEEAA